MLDMFNARHAIPADVWEAHRGISDNLGTRARNATKVEVAAYLDWIRRRAGLPETGKAQLHWIQASKRDNAICNGVTYGTQTAPAKWEGRQHTPTQWAPGSYSILMPGANAPRAMVTMETLGDDGEVLASSTMPLEPKKGGIVWSKADVAKAVGPIAKPMKVKAKRAKVEKAPKRPVQTQEAPAAMVEPSAPVSALPAPVPAPEAASDDVDPIAAITARLEALEAALAAMTAQAAAPAPVEAAPRRTAAHERAIRRAWAERKARRVFRDAAERATDERNQVQALLRQAHAKRARVVKLARKRGAERLEARLDALAWEYRAGEARNALGAVEARALAAEADRDRLAGVITDVGTRLAMAETAVRQLRAA